MPVPAADPEMLPRILPRKRFAVDTPFARRYRRIASLAAAAESAPAPFAIVPSRCNRCGSCLDLGCPAISDAGAEALLIEAAACVGCGVCAPLCRGRAISSLSAR